MCITLCTEIFQNIILIINASSNILCKLLIYYLLCMSEVQVLDQININILSLSKYIEVDP